MKTSCILHPRIFYVFYQPGLCWLLFECGSISTMDLVLSQRCGKLLRRAHTADCTFTSLHFSFYFSSLTLRWHNISVNSQRQKRHMTHPDVKVLPYLVKFGQTYEWLIKIIKIIKIDKSLVYIKSRHQTYNVGAQLMILILILLVFVPIFCALESMFWCFWCSVHLMWRVLLYITVMMIGKELTSTQSTTVRLWNVSQNVTSSTIP